MHEPWLVTGRLCMGGRRGSDAEAEEAKDLTEALKMAKEELAKERTSGCPECHGTSHDKGPALGGNQGECGENTGLLDPLGSVCLMNLYVGGCVCVCVCHHLFNSV